MKELREDKVTEIIGELVMRGSSVDMATANTLKKLFATEPEIQEGVPVICSNPTSAEPQHLFYDRPVGNKHGANSVVWEHCEIDYQRPGHVIPWNGGECPVDESTVTVFYRSGYADTDNSMNLLEWKHYDNNGDIIAYCIWPDWVEL